MPELPSNPAEVTSPPRSAARSRRTRPTPAAADGSHGHSVVTNGSGHGVPKRSVSGDKKKTLRKTRRTLQSIALPFFALLLLGTQWKTYFRTTIEKETSAAINLPQQKQQASTRTGSHPPITARHEEAQKLRAPFTQPNPQLSNHPKYYDKRPTKAVLGPKLEYSERQRPRDKVLYLLHIHKSGGTALCSMARFNLLSTSASNCNVQSDQRCCGNEDTVERQTAYAHRTKYDLVASEGRMYESMDPNSYSYILVLRQSLHRYYSHWKAAQQTYRQLPPSMRLEDEPERVAAGGAPPGSVVRGPIQPQAVDEQAEEYYAHMMDLVRESKEQRAQRREQKRMEIEAWKRNAVQAVEEAKRQPSLQQPQQQQQQQRKENSPPPPKPLKMEDFTVDANNNRGLFMPHRRLGLDDPQQSDHGQSETSQLVVNLARKASQAPPPPMFPHPAQDPAFRISGILDTRLPIFGRTFAQWWQAQPDNWNFRQLCGSHCQGIPKYQLTMDDWAYTLSRLLQFDTVLLLEDFQSSMDILAARHGWNQSNIDAMITFHDQEEERKAIAKERHLKQVTDTKVEKLSKAISKNSREYKDLMEEAAKVPSASTDAEWHDWYQQNKAKENGRKEEQIPEEEPRFKEKQFRHWEPLMSAVDDALYEIARRWEFLKLQKPAPPTLTPQELASLVNIYNLSPEVQDMFQFYMEEEGEHRTQCQNECCAELCSAW